MPVPRAVARFQRRFVHPVVRGLATRLPGYGLLIHVGRKSGRTYRVPLNVFATHDGGFAIVLAYGTNSDWLLNVRAAGTAELIKRRTHYRVNNPRIVSGPDVIAALPFYGRLASRLTRSPEVLLVDVER
jgi:deazaflavin-dependent oxidoreductase (nitroreductase family)